MKIAITFDVNKEQREAIAHYYGSEIPCYDECKDFLEGDAYSTLETLIQEHQDSKLD